MQKEKHANVVVIVYFLSLLMIAVVNMIESFSYVDVVYAVIVFCSIIRVIFITIEERR